MSLSIVFICLALVVGIYFYNNPLKHGPWFLSRRFINWFPLGMTYAFLYMGRYNLTVAKNALGSLMSNEDFGLIFAAGTITYAFSFLINGPLVDKIGGKKGILIAALGAAAANVALGVITWLVLTDRIHVRLLPIFSVTYALNMYFQSYGAVSIIKVKAHWFHVRERGVFGAIFGTLISFGVYFAFDWGQAIIDITKLNAPMPTSAVERLVRAIFVPPGLTMDATWAVFFVPAAILRGVGVARHLAHPRYTGARRFSASRYARRFLRSHARGIQRAQTAQDGFPQSADRNVRFRRADRRRPAQRDHAMVHRSLGTM